MKFFIQFLITQFAFAVLSVCAAASVHFTNNTPGYVAKVDMYTVIDNYEYGVTTFSCEHYLTYGQSLDFDDYPPVRYMLTGIQWIALDWDPANEYIQDSFLTHVNEGSGRLTWSQLAQAFNSGRPSEFALWNNFPPDNVGYRGLAYGFNTPPAPHEISNKHMEMTAADLMAAIEDLMAQGQNEDAKKLKKYFITMAHGITAYNAVAAEADKIDPETHDFFGDDSASLQRIGVSAEAVAHMIATVGLSIDNLFPKAVVLRAGRWIVANERMSLRAAIYQARITGVPVEAAYFIRGVKFDGKIGNILIEAKGPGYAKFFQANGLPKPWFAKGAEALVKQARRQVEAGGGATIQWHVAELEAANAIRALFQSRGITGVQVIHSP